jgi:Bacterial RNA polymerase, alpha chain C terminal domain
LKIKTFVEGERVRRHRLLRQDLGGSLPGGILVVHKVIEVPDIVCPPAWGWMGGRLREVVGHSQWLQVTDRWGKIIMNPDGNGSAMFSGMFFRKIPQPKKVHERLGYRKHPQWTGKDACKHLYPFNPIRPDLDIAMTSRLRRCLAHANLTVQEAAKKTDAELLLIKNFGQKALRELHEIFAERKLRN